MFIYYIAVALLASILTIYVSGKKFCDFTNSCSKKMSYEKTDIKQSVLYLITQLKPKIISVSEMYNIDARALALVLATENSLNVTIEDEIQNYLANYGVTSVLGKKFSYGLGQIKLDTAVAVEPLVAKIENRSVRSKETVAEKLIDVDESLSYAAGILLDAQIKYQEKDINISKNIAILATLYNLGNIDERVKALKPNHILRPNQFGIFAQNNLHIIEGILQRDSSNYKLDDDKRFYSFNQLNKPVEGHFAPDFCYKKIDKKSMKLKRERVTYKYKPVTTGEFRVLRSSLGCDFERWSLIEKSEQGGYYWVKNRDLLKSAEETKKEFNFKLTDQDIFHFKIVTLNKRMPASISSHYKNDCGYTVGQSTLICNFDYQATLEQLIVMYKKNADKAMFVSHPKLFFQFKQEPALKNKKLFLNNASSDLITFFDENKNNQITLKLH